MIDVCKFNDIVNCLNNIIRYKMFKKRNIVKKITFIMKVVM